MRKGRKKGVGRKTSQRSNSQGGPQFESVLLPFPQTSTCGPFVSAMHRRFALASRGCRYCLTLRLQVERIEQSTLSKEDEQIKEEGGTMGGGGDKRGVSGVGAETIRKC